MRPSPTRRELCQPALSTCTWEDRRAYAQMPGCASRRSNPYVDQEVPADAGPATRDTYTKLKASPGRLAFHSFIGMRL